MYSLYWSNLPEVDDGTCTAASENATLRENPNCLFWSACGLGNAADGQTEWLALEPNVGHVFEVRLAEVDCVAVTLCMNVCNVLAKGSERMKKRSVEQKAIFCAGHATYMREMSPFG